MEHDAVSGKPKDYKEWSIETLDGLSDAKLEDAIISFVFTKFFEAPDGTTRFEIISSLSLGFQMAWSTWHLWWSVAHGGFNEFFYESDEFTDMTLESLKLIDAMNYVEIFEQAIDAHREEMQNPIMKELYAEKTLHGYSESFKMSSLKEFDDRFIGLGYQLRELKTRFIRSNLQLFVGS